MWSDLFYRLRAIFRRKAVEHELDDELSFHISCQRDKHIAAGLSPIEAERRARLEFGGIDRAKEACRDERAISFADTTIQDIRYAIHKLRKSLHHHREERVKCTKGCVITFGHFSLQRFWSQFERDA